MERMKLVANSPIRLSKIEIIDTKFFRKVWINKDRKDKDKLNILFAELKIWSNEDEEDAWEDSCMTFIKRGYGNSVM